MTDYQASSRSVPDIDRPPADERRSASGRQPAISDPTVQVDTQGSVKSRVAGGTGLMTETFSAPNGSRIEFKFDAAVHLLVMYEAGKRHRGLTSIDGLDPSMLQIIADKMTFVPAGRGYYEWHEPSAPTRFTFVYLDPSRLQDPCSTGASYVPKVLFQDAALWETAAKLKGVIESDGAKSRRYAEALANVLLHELPRVEEHSAARSTACRGGLASWQVRAVKQTIEDHCGERVSLATLASLVRLSRHHFCRAFKESIGIPPHQYIVQRRIERAKRLLTDRTNSITDVALHLGYSQTSAFSVAFRKTTGRTARDFRRECAFES